MAAGALRIPGVQGRVEPVSDARDCRNRYGKWSDGELSPGKRLERLCRSQIWTLAIDRRKKDPTRPTLVPEPGPMGASGGPFYSWSAEPDGFHRGRDEATRTDVHTFRVRRRINLLREFCDIRLFRWAPAGLELFQDSARRSSRCRGLNGFRHALAHRLTHKEKNCRSNCKQREFADRGHYPARLRSQKVSRVDTGERRNDRSGIRVGRKVSHLQAHHAGSTSDKIPDSWNEIAKD